MTIERGGKKRVKPVKEDPKCPPHDMKQVHRSVDFKRGKKYISLFLECQRSGCNHKDATVKEG